MEKSPKFIIYPPKIKLLSFCLPQFPRKIILGFGNGYGFDRIVDSLPFNFDPQSLPLVFLALPFGSYCLSLSLSLYLYAMPVILIYDTEILLFPPKKKKIQRCFIP